MLGVLAGALIMILVGAFFVFRRRSKKIQPVALPEDLAALGLMHADRAVVGPQESADARLERQMEDNQAEQDQLEAEALGRIRLPANTKKTEVLVRHIRESVQKDPASAANVLRTWVAEMDTRR